MKQIIRTLIIPRLTIHRLALLTCFSLSCVTLPAFVFANGVVEPVKKDEGNTDANTTARSQKDKNRVGDNNIEVIEVSGRRNQANTEMTEETEKLFNVPSIANDPLSSVFSLPGIVYAGGDDGEPAIRGSSPDDNAFYIDNMPANYIFHMFGDSIFNKNVISDFSLYPAAFGSQYGNATGGVIDVKLRDPRNQDFSAIVDASMLKTGIMVEGGLSENQAFYFSYRRSLMHLFMPVGEEEDGETITKSPISDDYQGKYQWLIGDNQKLTFSATGASDVGALAISAKSEEAQIDPDSIGEMSLNTRFDQQTLSWQYFAENQDTLQISFSHMSEQNKEKYGQGQFIDLTTQRYNLRALYQAHWFDKHALNFGVDLQQSISDYSYDMIPYFCTDNDADCDSRKGERVQDIDTLKSIDSAIYFNDVWRLSEDVALELGLRAENNSYTKQSFVHPRLALNWFASNDLTVTTKYGTYSRFPDINTALKKLGNPKIKSPKAEHYSLGFAYDISDTWNTSIDFYYKDLGDMALALDEQQPNSALHYSNDLSGSAKGVEWVINKNFENGWYGWASLSWSNSERTNDLSKVTTDYYLDTPLLANVVANYQLNEQWDFGLRFTIRSGAKYTPIIGLHDNPDYPGYFQPTYGELNSKTLPVYYRLDLQANYKTTLFGLDSEVNFAMINATNNANVSGYSYQPTANDSINNVTLVEDTGMEMFPSIGLTVKF